MKKSELLKECARIMAFPEVAAWYEKNLQGQPQSETIKTLEIALADGKISIRAALSIALVTGFQWNVKDHPFPRIQQFPGEPKQ